MPRDEDYQKEVEQRQMVLSNRLFDDTVREAQRGCTQTQLNVDTENNLRPISTLGRTVERKLPVLKKKSTAQPLDRFYYLGEHTKDKAQRRSKSLSEKELDRFLLNKVAPKYQLNEMRPILTQLVHKDKQAKKGPRKQKIMDQRNTLPDCVEEPSRMWLKYKKCAR